tara:strand:+ start:9155 stop:11323 length:2169 start_codon:yes stop_codon:yes gene_type:complete
MEIPINNTISSYQEPGKYYTMFLAILTMITALTISAVAIYYSVAGLVAIFAAAAVPIMIMGGTLEVAKLVTAVWLHRYWQKATWWLKTYLSIAVVVLMIITSMGIFGFLSKAHIEQTSASEESVAKVEQINKELGRLDGIIVRAEQKIKQLESSGTGADANLQAQIDKEQDRIDKAFERIQPAIDQQNKIIEDARAGDANRTKPYEDQLTNIQNEITRLESTAREYEDKIANLKANQGAVDPLLQQIKKIEEEIIRVTNQLQSTEKAQIRAGQAIIGVSSDGLFGNNTREALAKWVAAQQERISQIQGEVSQLRKDASSTVAKERERLAGVVKNIREKQIPALKDRELVMLGKIDDVRKTESPVIQTARDEIQRLRKSAEDQVKNSQQLIERLRGQLAQTDKVEEIDAAVDEQNLRIKNANNEIDLLTEEKYSLEAEYRKLEAEVGPIKYIAEFVYGEKADKNLLEEAVRWVIIVIIFVFDPLAVLLLIASQYTFDFIRKPKDESWREYEQKRAAMIMANEGPNNDTPTTDDAVPEPTDDRQDDGDEERNDLQDINVADDERNREDIDEPSIPSGETVEETTEQIPTPQISEYEKSINVDDEPVTVQEALESEEAKTVDSKKKVESSDVSEKSSDELLREQELAEQDEDPGWREAKQSWKKDHPNDKIKNYKNMYVKGIISKLPWETYVKSNTENKQSSEGYIQNEEQNNSSIWNRIQNKDD